MADSSSSSDNESDSANYSDIHVTPYRFEPVVDPNHQPQADNTPENPDVHVDRIGNVQWCKCGLCSPMETGLESLCCQEVPAVQHRIGENVQCITIMDGFIANCLNIDVLETSFYEFLSEHGPIGDDEKIHKMYRHVAYRRFTRYIWRLLGKHVRKVIPSCAVTKIRSSFPAEEYTHFKYPKP